ncbi:MAG: CRISPR-associated protein Cas5 [Thermacetogeniaceae bacterium]
MRGFAALRIRVTAPSAHFRVPQTSDPRHTYLVPPYSTVIGFLANILGSKDDIGRLLAEPFGLGILCRAGAITQEYTWLRNLSSGSHKERFGTLRNRAYQDIPEHPGGQQPVTFFILNDVEVLIYLVHPDDRVIATLKENAFRPERWISHLHLGRSEDWAVLEEVSDAEISLSSQPNDSRNAPLYRQWMPDPGKGAGAFVYRPQGVEPGDYEDFWERVAGSANLIASVYRLRGDGGCRDFEYIPVRLFDGSIPWLAPGRYPRLYCDAEKGVPVFFARIDARRIGVGEEEKDGVSCQEQRNYTC